MTTTIQQDAENLITILSGKKLSLVDVKEHLGSKFTHHKTYMIANRKIDQAEAIIVNLIKPELVKCLCGMEYVTRYMNKSWDTMMTADAAIIVTSPTGEAPIIQLFTNDATLFDTFKSMLISSGIMKSPDATKEANDERAAMRLAKIAAKKITVGCEIVPKSEYTRNTRKVLAISKKGIVTVEYDNVMGEKVVEKLSSVMNYKLHIEK